MSKRELKKYAQSLTKEQLEEQLVDLYDRFKEVKTFYNFVFQPKEDKLLEDAKFKIGKEYFPVSTRKAKARRSVAQKIIKHFIQLGVDPSVTAEVMLYNLEIAQQYASKKNKLPDAFFKSMYNSFQEAVEFIEINGLQIQFLERLKAVALFTDNENWPNSEGFLISLGFA